MEWFIGLALLAVIGAFILVPMITGGVALFAMPSAPSRAQAKQRLEQAPQVLAETFDGRLNATFVRDLYEPITTDMVMEAANGAGYAFVSKDNAAGRITYHFVRSGGLGTEATGEGFQCDGSNEPRYGGER